MLHRPLTQAYEAALGTRTTLPAEPVPRIELGSQPYEGRILPLN